MFSFDVAFVVEIPLGPGDVLSSKIDFGASVLGNRPHLILLKRESNSFWLIPPKLLLTAELSTVAVAGAAVDCCALVRVGLVNGFKLI